MLARLAALPNVRGAETDHGGSLLRVRIDGEPAATAIQVRDLLADSGYEAALVPEVDRAGVLATVARWYDAEGARELSLEEARAVAPRVAADFAAAHGLSNDTRALLERSLRALIEESFRLEAAQPLRSRVHASIDRLLDAMRGHLDERRLAALGDYLLDRWQA